MTVSIARVTRACSVAFVIEQFAAGMKSLPPSVMTTCVYGAEPSVPWCAARNASAALHKPVPV